MSVLALPNEILSLSFSYMSIPERWWVRRVCTRFASLNEDAKYDACMADYVLWRSEKTALLSALFVYHIVTKSDLILSISYASPSFFIWLLRSKLLSVNSRLLDHCSRNQFSLLLEVYNPAQLKYFPKIDNPVKMKLYLTKLNDLEGFGGYRLRNLAAELWMHVLTRPLWGCKDVLQIHLPFLSNFAWRHVQTKTAVLLKILSSKYSYKTKIRMLGFPPLVFQPTGKVVLILALFGSKWHDIIRWTRPFARHDIRQAYQYSFFPARTKRTFDLKYANVYNNLNIFNVARRANLPFGRLTESIRIRDRKQHSLFCATRLKTGFRKGDFCMNRKCKVHPRD